MKQTLLMFLLLFLGTIGAFVKGPFYGVAVYYLLAILRPQYLWKWAITVDLRWSFCVVIATIVAIFFWRPTDYRNLFKPGIVVMLGFAVWISLSNYFALDNSVSSKWYEEYLKIFVMFFCGVAVIKHFSQIRALYLIAVIALGYIAYEMNYLYIFSGRMDIVKYGYGGLDNNGAGLMLAMGIPMAYFMWQGSSRWWRWFFLAMVPVMLHAVLMSYSRGAMLSLLISVPLIVVRSKRKKGMILAMIGFMVFLPVLAGQEIRQRFFSVSQYDEDESAHSRFGSWAAGLGIAQDYPIFGAGIRNSNLLTYQYGADMEGRTIHSQYLQIAADSGFPAMVLYIAVLLIAWRTLRQFQRQHRYLNSYDYKLSYSLACGIESALAVFCIGAAFLSLEVFELPYLLILMALTLPSTFLNENAITIL